MEEPIYTSTTSTTPTPTLAEATHETRYSAPIESHTLRDDDEESDYPHDLIIYEENESPRDHSVDEEPDLLSDLSLYSPAESLHHPAPEDVGAMVEQSF